MIYGIIIMKISALSENITVSSSPAGIQSQQAPKFGRDPKVLEDDKIEETTAGCVASVAQPMGGMQKRKGSGALLRGITTSAKYPNSKAVKEEEIKEQDVIINPTMKSGPKPGFHNRMDHEGDTVKNSLHTIIRVSKALNDRIDNHTQFPEWVSEKIGAIKSNMVTVMDYIISQQERGDDHVIDEFAMGEEDIAEVKTRLDPKCWTGYKKQGTKMKGGVRVNNCVPNTNEAANPAQQAAIAIAKKKKKGVAEGSDDDEIEVRLDGKVIPGPYNDFDHARNKASKLVSYQKGKIGEVYVNGKLKIRMQLNTPQEHFEEGVAEGLGKDIKRAAQGWGGAQDKPADIVKRNKGYDTDTAKKVRAGLDDAPDHTPAGLQKRVLDRKLKGVAEAYTPSAGELARDLIKMPDSDFSKKYGMSKQQANHYYSSSKLKEQGVAEGELETYQVSVMDTQTKEHWTIEVKVTSAQAAKERAEAQGFKVLRVKKEQGVAEGSDDIASAKERLAQLEKQFDSSYEYSDDHSVWKKHNAIRQEMDRLKKIIGQGKHSVEEESKGLWANIHAKRERIKHGSGERMRKPGSKGAPTADALRKSAK